VCKRKGRGKEGVGRYVVAVVVCGAVVGRGVVGACGRCVVCEGAKGRVWQGGVTAGVAVRVAVAVCVQCVCALRCRPSLSPRASAARWRRDSMVSARYACRLSAATRPFAAAMPAVILRRRALYAAANDRSLHI